MKDDKPQMLIAMQLVGGYEPYNVARQYKALDIVSHGRIGWNAVTTSNPGAAANFGAEIRG